jgi:hypothetical protein
MQYTKTKAALAAYHACKKKSKGHHSLGRLWQRRALAELGYRVCEAFRIECPDVLTSDMHLSVQYIVSRVEQAERENPS